MSESVSEFFDAQEVLLSASSSENEVRRDRVEYVNRWVGGGESERLEDGLD